MCGRAVQTRRSIESAEEILHQQCNQDNIQFNPSPCSTIFQNDNYNLAPGSHGVVFHASQHNNTDSNADSNADASHSSSAAGAPSNKPATTTSSAGSTVIVSSAKTWGLCPKNGTINHPLPDGPGKHFSNLMYNARSDTLYSKRTFSKLALESQTCLWPVHGYYEWKHDEGDVLLSKGKGGKRKQPYLVKRREKERDGGNRNGNRKPSFLLIPGLWNRVKTGRKIRIEAVKGEGMNACTNTGQEILQDEFIETFTLITTEACSSLQWLHHRQPILLDNLDLAMEWLLHPNSDVLNRMRKEAKDMGLGLGEELLLTAGDGDIINTKEKNTQNGNGLIEWYPVTKNMSKLGYKSKDCVDQIKIEKVASVKSFFTAAGGEKRKSSCTTSVGGDEAKINVGVFAANGAGTGAGTGVAFASASPLKRTKVETNKMKVGMNGNSARSPRKSKSQSPGKAKVAEDRGGSIASFFTKKAQKK